MDKKPENPRSPSAKPAEQDQSTLNDESTSVENTKEAADKPAARPGTKGRGRAAKSATKRSPSAVKAETESVTSEPQPEVKPQPEPQPKPEPKAEQPAPAPERPREGSGQGPALMVAVVALLIAAAAVGYTVWQGQQRQAQLMQSQSLSGKLDELRNRMGAERNQLEQRLVEQDRQQQALIKQVTGLQGELVKARERQPRDWLLAESDYLVQMAARKLWLEQDVATAIALLKDADRRLNLMKDEALTPVRQALRDDITVLQGLPRQDLAGVALTIESLINSVDRWPLNRVELPDLAQAEVSDSPSESVSDWKSNLAKSWNALVDDFITIRRRQGELQPLLAPEQEWYLREHLKGKLMQAQLALYHGHTDAYRKALSTAADWVETYFKRDEATIEGALTSLAELQRTELGSRLPDSLASQPLLEALVQDRLGRESQG
ncbi:uroporphyrinogen-III C-methyltransferase [Ferrimonas sp. YFM]|uniref:uroporphyrinogen-III C-methyltransferase n=1 Tax=Ferrimonas sp. YFM TaxID=3028878 RepID=UPI002572EF49|nr:uroporphyrinogen-III C-methyltransferase [Ferrimonas sp. YFM]BDY06880.1 heme biosynthesis operon protein HemX [Ferrimonas sp. YFM]